MREPKYKLNKQDDERHRLLLTRHCCEVGKPNRKYPPLTPAENVEFEKLERKLRRKQRSKPGMREYYRKNARRARYLRDKCLRLLAQLEVQLRKVEKDLSIAEPSSAKQS